MNRLIAIASTEVIQLFLQLLHSLPFLLQETIKNLRGAFPGFCRKKVSERTYEGRSRQLKLVTMKERKLAQDLLPLWCQVDNDTPLIGSIPHTFDETSLHQAINQLDRTMVSNLESLGQLTDRGFPPGGQSLERK